MQECVLNPALHGLTAGGGGGEGGSGAAWCGPGMIQMAGEAVFFFSPILLVCYVAR